MARKKKHPAHVNHERWLISYADFITLLFAFFVVMFAVSKVDAKKVGRFQDSFSLAVGLTANGERGYLPRVEDEGPPLNIMAMPMRSSDPASLPKGKRDPGPPPFPLELRQLQNVFEEKKAIEKSLAGVKIIRRGSELVLRLDATALFDSGNDKVKPNALEALRTIADQVREHDVQIRVEGHTDDMPIKTLRFRSNWDLSTARATSVVAVLAASGKIPPGRIAAIGYAEFQPLAPNDSNDSRAKNRRVDFVLSVTMAIPTEVPQENAVPALNQSTIPDM